MTLPPDRAPGPRITPAAADDVTEVLHDLVDGVIAEFQTPARQAALDPLAVEGKRQKPFLVALFPGVIRAMELERSISTRLGTRLQVLAAAIARGAGLEAEVEYEVEGDVAPGALDYINHLSRPNRARERPTDRPDLPDELSTLRNLNKGAMVAHSVKLDLFVQGDGDPHFFDLKTPSPNSEQPPNMKGRLMRVRALHLPREAHAYAVFYYNPGGLEGSYRQGQAYLDYEHGEVLVGREFWNLLAGEGTYEELVGLFQEVGADRQEDLTGLLRADDD